MDPVSHLGGAAGGVHQAHGALPHIVRRERAREQLVVRLVDGVAALERQHVLARRQRRPHLHTRQKPGQPTTTKLS